MLLRGAAACTVLQGDLCHWGVPVPLELCESAKVFGSMFCVKWHPRESQDPGFCSKMVSVIPRSCGVNVVADGCKPSCP